ncbi:MAG: polysaccharide deacetylase family protein [Bacilli bacterium]|nr:polysaccharide deacetylase family protein [Bacilli bacterium]
MKKKKVNIDDNILIKKKKSTKSTNNYKRNTKQQYNKNQVKNEKVKKDSIKENLNTKEAIEKKESKKIGKGEHEKKLSKKKKIVIIVSLIMTFMVATSLLYVLVFDKKVYIDGFVKEDKVLVNTEYQEKKFKICYGTIVNCKDIKINKEGEVDTTKLGEYSLIYKYRIGKKEESLTRRILVYDDIKPEIIIDEELSFCKNGKVGHGSFHATDNYDGEITSNVKLSIEGDKSYLEVTDSSGNKESIEVNALEFTSDPTITLNGNSSMYINIGGTYSEKGATASDICDGDISDKIVTSGSVNTNQAGTYTITYSVENSSGKKAEIKRTVIVQNKVAVASGSSCSKIGAIYLTFDDGPGSGTESILNTLRDEGVKATFFVTASGSDYLIKREHDEGHVVALHTASHNYARIYSSVDAYFNDLNIVASRVKRITGIDSKIIRFPGGSSNTVSRNYAKGIMTTLTREVIARGYRYHDWNVDSNDAGSCRTSACVYSYVVYGLSKSRCNMVLMHDIKNYTAGALRDIIHFGKENGYTFEVIDINTPMVTQKVNN